MGQRAHARLAVGLEHHDREVEPGPGLLAVDLRRRELLAGERPGDANAIALDEAPALRVRIADDPLGIPVREHPRTAANGERPRRRRGSGDSSPSSTSRTSSPRLAGEKRGGASSANSGYAVRQRSRSTQASRAVLSGFIEQHLPWLLEFADAPSGRGATVSTECAEALNTRMRHRRARIGKKRGSC